MARIATGNMVPILKDLTTGRVREVADLPAAASNQGAMFTVTDATDPDAGETVAGGGAVVALVWSDGTNWKVVAPLSTP
jgi:hypothetical protein